MLWWLEKHFLPLRTKHGKAHEIIHVSVRLTKFRTLTMEEASNEDVKRRDMCRGGSRMRPGQSDDGGGGSMTSLAEARVEAVRRRWPWVVYDPHNKRWGYARIKPVPGDEEFLYLSASMSYSTMKIAAFD